MSGIIRLSDIDSLVLKSQWGNNKNIAKDFSMVSIIETHWRFSCLMNNLDAVFCDKAVHIAGIW